MKELMQSIGKEQAIKLYNSGWWKTKSHREVAKFQLLTRELSVPFEVFHEAVEKSLGRPIWTHEFASSNIDNILMEFFGEAKVNERSEG